MLIKVFGIWLMASNIATLQPDKNTCVVYFVSGAGYGRNFIIQSFSESCDAVAQEINRQIKESK